MCEDNMLGLRVKARRPIRKVIAKVDVEHSGLDQVVSVKGWEVTRFGIDAQHCTTEFAGCVGVGLEGKRAVRDDFRMNY